MAVVVNFETWQGRPNGKLIKELYLLAAGYIESVNVVNYVVLKGGLSFKPEAWLFKIDFAPDSCTFSEGMADTQHGSVFNPQIRFTRPNGDVIFADYLLKTRYSDFAAIFRDANHQWYLCSGGLRLVFNTQIAQINSLEAILSADNRTPTYMMADTSFESIITAPEFSSEFSSDFNS